jgi:subtilisin-like proprotein convertase family protein
MNQPLNAPPALTSTGSPAGRIRRRYSLSFVSLLRSLLGLFTLLLTGLSQAQITSPEPYSTLTASANFQWTSTATSTYVLMIGSTAGGTNYHNSGLLPIGTSSRTVTGLPTTSVVYVTFEVRTPVNTPEGPQTLIETHRHRYNVDLDNDGILDAIDPNPGSPNSKTTRTEADHTMELLGSGRVASIVSPTLFSTTADGAGGAEMREVTKRVYQHFKDDFDFIFVASNRSDSPTGQAGVHFSVSNSVGGIGKSIFSNNAAYGSTAKLQSVLHLATRDGMVSGPTLHEVMHRWGNSITNFFPGIVNDPGHWGISSVGGTLGGYQAGTRELVAGNTYKAKSPRTANFDEWYPNANGGNGVRYSSLELYLMGMIDKSAVTDVMEVANDAVFDYNTGQFTATGFTTVTMAQITGASPGYGDRSPTSATAQKVFRSLLVVLTDVPLTNPQWSLADETVEIFSRTSATGISGLHNFWSATNGIGSMNMGNLASSLNPNADLAGLTFSAGALSPVFNPAVRSYTVNAPGAASTTVTATRADPAATMEVRVNGGTFSALASGVASSALSLPAGPSVVEVKVTNGGYSRTYVVSVLTSSVFPALAGSLGTIPEGVGNPGEGPPRDVQFTVSGMSGTLSNVVVDFTLNPIHTWGSDLIVKLIAPNGTATHTVLSLTHMFSTGGSYAGPYTFADYASGPLSTALTAANGGTVAPGLYRTQSNNDTVTAILPTFSSVTGAAINGTWTLRFTDRYEDTPATPAAVSAANLYLVTSAPPSSNADLTSLSFSAGSIAPTFAAGTTSYSFSVPNATASTTVTAARAEANATLQVQVNGGSFTPLTSGVASGALALNVGSNPVVVRVTAQNGTQKNYTTTITRAAPTSSNADLTSLSFGAGSIAPTFAAGTTAYSFSVPNATASTTVTAARAEANATLQVQLNGGSFTTLTSGVASGALALNVGSNPVVVRVTAQDGTTLKNYTTTITRAAPAGGITWGAAQSWTGDATQVLTNGVRHSAVCFAPADTTVNGVTFDRPTVTTGISPVTFANASPVTVTSGFFQAADSAWAVTTGDVNFRTLVNHANYHFNAPSTITLGGLTVGQTYQVQVFMPYWGLPWPTSFASSGGASVVLNAGVKATPTAAEFVTGTFTAAATSHVINYLSVPLGTWAGVSAISVRRTSLSSNADLAALTTTAGNLSPVFAAGTASYTVTASVPNTTSSVTVTPTKADAGASIQARVNGSAYAAVTSGSASGPLALNVGSNSINVAVTAENGTTLKTYTITVTRAGPAGSGEVVGTNLGAIPDGSETGRDVEFNVTGRTGNVTAVTVQFTLNPIHTYVGDLIIRLIAPDDTVASIFRMGNVPPANGADLGGPYTISDNGLTTLSGTAINLGSVLLPSGAYRAEDGGVLVALNTVFGGKDPNGIWRLRFVDTEGDDSGSVSQASLNLTTSSAPAIQPRASIVYQANTNRQITLTNGVPNSTYVMQRSTNLSAWTNLGTVTTNAAGTAVYSDTTAPATRYFYRFTPGP